MKHPNPKTLETKQWLEKAKRDIEQAKHDLTAETPYTDSAVFHCQQAAEKALKGFLTWKEITFKKTHSIAEIGAQVIAIDQSLHLTINPAINLTPYATVFRYPGDIADPSEQEAAEAVEIAENLLKAILTKLPKL
ncbi:MAG: HEPN domain-containing protein [Deltaproteobacteria bacterium]|nr:HEPN domain-containing protein [Deltaproteobacteria bacterium]